VEAPFRPYAGVLQETPESDHRLSRRPGADRATLEPPARSPPHDGKWVRRLGNVGGCTVGWAGKAGLSLVAVSEAIDCRRGDMGALGRRFVLYRLPAFKAPERIRPPKRHHHTARGTPRQLHPSTEGLRRARRTSVASTSWRGLGACALRSGLKPRGALCEESWGLPRGRGGDGTTHMCSKGDRPACCGSRGPKPTSPGRLVVSPSAAYYAPFEPSLKGVDDHLTVTTTESCSARQE